MAISNYLQTRVKNTSGKKMKFGFLPPHGRTLDIGEIISIDGDLMARLSADKRSVRLLNALSRALADGALSILDNPSIYYVDNTTSAVKTLDVNNGAVAIANPGWGATTA